MGGRVFRHAFIKPEMLAHFRIIEVEITDFFGMNGQGRYNMEKLVGSHIPDLLLQAQAIESRQHIERRVGMLQRPAGSRKGGPIYKIEQEGVFAYPQLTAQVVAD